MGPFVGKRWSGKIFWLDVKNLTIENAESFYRHINLLNDKYKVKDRIIIESGNPVPLKQIADSGYLTSLYFPVNGSSNTLNSDSSVFLYIVNTSGLISQDAFWLNLMNKSYPEKKKIIWDISFCTSLNTGVLKKYIADTTVLLCLINIKSPGYRWVFNMKQSVIFNRFHFLILVVALVPFHLFLRMIFFVWNRTFFREVNSSLFELLKYAFQINLASIALINLPVIFLWWCPDLREKE